MPAVEPSVEASALRRSIVAGAALGAVGVVWGLATGSQLLLLDGAYAFVGVVVSWLLLLASRLVGIGPTPAYPYGREALTPMVVAVQGFVLLATVVYAAVGAARSIVDGGSEVEAGWALVYAVITTVASVALWRWLVRIAGGSDLLVADAAAWRISSTLGGGMVVTFAVILVLSSTEWSDAVPYVDPVMVLVICVALVRPPVEMVRVGFVELLEGRPPTAVEAAVENAVDETFAARGAEPSVVRMTKVGQKVYVEVEGLAAADVTIGQEHELRLALERRCDELPFDVWLNVELRPRPTSGVVGQVVGDP